MDEMTAPQEKLLAQLTARYQKIAEQAAEDAKAVDRIAAGLGTHGWLLSGQVDQLRRIAARISSNAKEVL